VQGLAEGYAEAKDEQRNRHPDAPAGHLLAPAAPAALATLDRGECRHGV
jgi:hypothetical protein